MERLHSEKRMEEHEKEKQKNTDAIPLQSGQSMVSFGWSNSMFI